MSAPKLIIYTDLSPNFPFAFSLLQARANDLKKTGCHIPSPIPWTFGRIPSHQPLWASLNAQNRKEKKFPLYLKNWLKNFYVLAHDRKNILFYGRSLSFEQQIVFLDILQNQKELDGYQTQIIAVIGRPACIFEQNARLVWPNKAADKTWQAMAKDCGRMNRIIDLWNRELGTEHVVIFSDPAVLPVATGLSSGHKSALSLLGLDSPQQCDSAHLLSLASREARHLAILSSVGNNGWPFLDKGQLVRVLSELDKKEKWDMRPISPPKYRELLVQTSGSRLEALESALGLEQGDLSCPDQLLPDAGWEGYYLLADEIIEAFVAALPKELAAPLQYRYDQDQDLLWPGHKRIRKQLAETYPTNKKSQLYDPNAFVSVLTLAHNQEQYIAQCIESVLMQKTDFPIQHIILDHCSTDNTPRIIEKYAAKHPSIRPVLLTQWISGQNVRGLFSRCRTKYAAICEGDDYFTDPDKLQKQADFLEEHPDCALCFHPVDVIYEDGSPSRVYPPEDLLPRGARNFFTLKDLLFANLIQTNSVMYRWRFRDGLPDWFDPTLVPGDWYWHILHAETGLIGYLPGQHMSVYRRHVAALYATSEINHVVHRQAHGLNELRTYDVCNKHFEGKYYDAFSRLATGVLADFVHIYMESGDDSLLVRAAEIFPEFTNNFLKQMQNL